MVNYLKKKKKCCPFERLIAIDDRRWRIVNSEEFRRLYRRGKRKERLTFPKSLKLPRPTSKWRKLGLIGARGEKLISRSLENDRPVENNFEIMVAPNRSTDFYRIGLETRFTIISRTPRNVNKS